jgi:hypothetical protein
MGQITEARIAEWQRRAGIEPAHGETWDSLQRMSARAVDLVKIIELEKSGIRDGDGYWHGCDPIAETMRDLLAAFSAWQGPGPKAPPARTFDAETGRMRRVPQTDEAQRGQVNESG